MDGNKKRGAGGGVGEKGAKLCPEAQIWASAAIGRMGGGEMGGEDRKKDEMKGGGTRRQKDTFSFITT